MNIDENAATTLFIGAVRYAIGRQSYIVSVTCDVVRNHWVDLDANTRAVIARDVTEELERAERAGRTVGAEMDHRQWRKLADFMEKT